MDDVCCELTDPSYSQVRNFVAVFQKGEENAVIPAGHMAHQD